MSESLTFAKVHHYDTRKAGITLTATLHCGEEQVEVEAKLDTGASHCVFKRAHGELLGLDIESGILQRIGTATGEFYTYGHEVTLEVLSMKTTAVVYFAAEASFTRNVLGRTGWLDRVKLGLIDYEGKLLLSPYSEDER